ncbi:SDH family Clp fold serine proteinase, partial [Methanococcoides vulcani]
ENKIQDEEKRKSVAQKLLSGEMIHVTPISAKEAIELGLPVSTKLPSEVHDFMKFFRSAKMSVEYIE